jgi:large subunit ribosomal protein L30
MKNDLKGKLIAAVRVRGSPNVRADILETLDRLHLKRPNNCAVFTMTESYGGMINKCKDYIAYGEVSEDILAKMIGKSEMKVNAKDLISGNYDKKELAAKMPFRLHPPRHGYKGAKISFSDGGVLGYMGSEINGLIKRMV